jgi:hypothetical protein
MKTIYNMKTLKTNTKMMSAPHRCARLIPQHRQNGGSHCSQRSPRSDAVAVLADAHYAETAARLTLLPSGPVRARRW